jgi:hypothetical protein
VRGAMTKIAAAKRGRRWCAIALVALALAAIPAPATSGIDDQPPAVEGPWIIEVGPEIAVIPEPGASFAIIDAGGSARACEATVGCAAILDEGVGAVVIVDQSPVSVVPASPAPSAAASEAGAAPR